MTLPPLGARGRAKFAKGQYFLFPTFSHEIKPIVNSIISFQKRFNSLRHFLQREIKTNAFGNFGIILTPWNYKPTCSISVKRILYSKTCHTSPVSTFSRQVLSIQSMLNIVKNIIVQQNV